MPSARLFRAIALALLIIGLHLLALLTIAPRLGGGAVPALPPPLMEARLIAATPPPAPKPPAPRPPRRPPPRARPAPPVPPAPNALAPLAQPAAEAAPQLAALAVESGAIAAIADVESLAVRPSAPPPPASAPAPEVLVGHAYRTDVPPSSRILLEVARKDADGTLWHGEAAMAWRLDGGQYKLKLEAGIRVLVTRVNLVVLESAGQIDAAGFVPHTMTEKRRGRAQTATRFGQGGANKITFSATPATYAIDPGTQDKATVPLQLAAIARADSDQLKGNIDILVGEDRDASVFRFVLLGQEDIDTPFGRLATWHLSRPPRAGAYGSRLDVWLAPSLGWVPVRIDNIEASGAMTTQTVKNIDRPDAG